ncbi:MAG TPA: hypothetical protein VFO14_25740 [Vicinamibacterales bacterium]|nr:hypothetical protein [Vicinamibacterales bacterium]
MKAVDLLNLLREFYRDKLALYRRHVAAARHISHYDFNNTYQYVIAREDVQLAWLRDAITDMAGELEDVAEPKIEPDGRGDAAQAAILEEDRQGAARFVEKWRPRIEAVTNARHRNMLRVILGETLEHQRFFEQALAGRTDLLGRRADGAGTGGGVLPTRWVS